MRKLLCASALVSLLAVPAQAQDFPSGPVTLIVPFAAGGNTDVFARILAPALQEAWGQPVIVENRPGGGTMVATAYVSQARPDGQTLLVTTSAYTTAPALNDSLPFDPRADLAPVASAGFVSFMLLTNAEAGYESLEQFIAATRDEPLFMASAGMGTTAHFAAEKFILDSGADMEVVHYAGGGPAILALLGGEADMYVSSMGSAGEHLTSGRLRPLTVLGSNRIPALPDTPTTQELGYPDLDIIQWLGVFAPAGVPEATLDRIHADVTAVTTTPAFMERVAAMDFTVTPTSRADFAGMVDRELTRWRTVADAVGMRAN